MIDEQAVLDLVIHVGMAQSEARYFLLLLDDWQRKDHLSDEQAAQIKQAAIDSGIVTGYGPVKMLLSFRHAMKGMKQNES